jgi:hypothetical protein
MRIPRTSPNGRARIRTTESIWWVPGFQLDATAREVLALEEHKPVIAVNGGSSALADKRFKIGTQDQSYKLL